MALIIIFFFILFFKLKSDNNLNEFFKNEGCKKSTIDNPYTNILITENNNKVCEKQNKEDIENNYNYYLFKNLND